MAMIGSPDLPHLLQQADLSRLNHYLVALFCRLAFSYSQKSISPKHPKMQSFEDWEWKEWLFEWMNGSLEASREPDWASLYSSTVSSNRSIWCRNWSVPTNSVISWAGSEGRGGVGENMSSWILGHYYCLTILMSSSEMQNEIISIQ
jgi:hypothetical protein